MQDTGAWRQLSAWRRHQRRRRQYGKLRPRVPTKLGDIVSSAPLFVGRPPFRYRDKPRRPDRHEYSAFVFRERRRASARRWSTPARTTACCTASMPTPALEVLRVHPGPVFARLLALSGPELCPPVLRRRFAQPGRRVLGQQLAYSAGRRPEQGRPGHLRAGRHQHARLALRKMPANPQAPSSGSSPTRTMPISASLSASPRS